MPTKRIKKYWIYLDDVKTQIRVKSVAISSEKIRLDIGETKLLAYSVFPKNAAYMEVTWTSDNPNIADVNEDGLVTAKRSGKTTIRVTINRKQAKCAVEVVDIIKFADPKVKEICVRNWDIDGDGEISKLEASRVKEIPIPLFTGQPIETFDELAYFTNLKTIGVHAFDSCSYLTSITFPQSLKTICKNAFSRCSSMEKITISPGVTNIGTGAFTYCSSLKTVCVNNPVPPINGDNIFDYCDSLEDIEVPDRSVLKYCETVGWGIDNDGDYLYYSYIWPHGFDYTFDFFLS